MQHWFHSNHLAHISVKYRHSLFYLSKSFTFLSFNNYTFSMFSLQ
ncbi:hypothetical protein FM106_18960 [Brachybacterium faecium]|nr:hypothetical protein FM106_18960 [Brachybacterium faecium]